LRPSHFAHKCHPFLEGSSDHVVLTPFPFALMLYVFSGSARRCRPFDSSPHLVHCPRWFREEYGAKAPRNAARRVIAAQCTGVSGAASAGGRLHLRPFKRCILFLASSDGAELITIEDLACSDCILCSRRCDTPPRNSAFAPRIVMSPVRPYHSRARRKPTPGCVTSARDPADARLSPIPRGGVGRTCDTRADRPISRQIGS